MRRCGRSCREGGEPEAVDEVVEPGHGVVAVLGEELVQLGADLGAGAAATRADDFGCRFVSLLAGDCFVPTGA